MKKEHIELKAKEVYPPDLTESISINRDDEKTYFIPSYDKNEPKRHFWCEGYTAAIEDLANDKKLLLSEMERLYSYIIPHLSDGELQDTIDKLKEFEKNMKK